MLGSNKRTKLSSVSKLSCFTILASTLSIRHIVRSAIGVGPQNASRNILFCNAFVTAAPNPPSFSRKTSTDSASDKHMDSTENTQSECQVEKERYSDISKHAVDQSLWMYHVESTTSTMDEAKLLIENKFVDKTSQQCKSNEEELQRDSPTSFIISATSQSKGRGTSKRNWKSAQTGNALFTIGIQQSAWMNDLKSRNGGIMVPLTLLPLKVGSIVATHVQKFLMDCSNDESRVTVKWPNDVLLYNQETASHEKVAGILIESSQDWFLIGIGINVGYAPDIPSEGVDYGRKATALHKHCKSSDAVDNELNYIDVAKQLGKDVGFTLHSWLYPSRYHLSSQIGHAVLEEWKSFVHWDMELILRDTPNNEKVTLKEVLADGRVVVQEVETGLTRTLVSDYFL